MSSSIASVEKVHVQGGHKAPAIGNIHQLLDFLTILSKFRLFEDGTARALKFLARFSNYPLLCLAG